MHYGQLRKLQQIQEAVRSGLEKRVLEDLREKGIEPDYETIRVRFTRPSKPTYYTPDIILPNGILVECKGVFESKDRTKHLAIKAEHPQLDIRFVFSRSSSPLYKGSDTTYAMWCEEHDFKYADKLIPQSWLEERNVMSLAHIIGSADIKQTKSGTRTKASSPTSSSTKRKSRSKTRGSSTTAETNSTET